MTYDEAVANGLEKFVAKPGEQIFNFEHTVIYDWETKEWVSIPDDVKQSLIKDTIWRNAMGRYNVKYNGQFAAFSTNTYLFVSEFTDRSSFNNWREKEYGSDVCPLTETEFIPIDDAVLFIRMNRTHDEAMEILISSGIPLEEGESLMGVAEDELNKL